MNTVGTHKYHCADICIIGGGMSGLTAAVAAARHGAKVVLMHDRPVLGGNASSEIRMWIRGAAGKENRETGILQEIELENIYRNPTMNYAVWDTVLYQMILQEENITLLLNCSCLSSEMEGDSISSVTGWQLNSYTFHTVKADIFMDCSGDSILAELTGAAYRVGRESRRYEGPYILTQQDLEEGHTFPDAVAFGGWTMDNHNPKGFKYLGYSSHHIAVKVPYQIPFRCLYSKNIPNLMFAGRNISATHMAMSSTRVMATCAVIGQAAGTGAALAISKKCSPAEVTALHMEELQQQLLEDGCFIPEKNRPLTGNVQFDLPPEEVTILNNGWDRPHDGNTNTVMRPDGSALTVTLSAPASALRLALDPDFSRESISAHSKYQKFAMRTHIDENTVVSMPKNLLKSCTVTVETSNGVQIRKIENNRRALLIISLPEDARRVTLEAMESWGGEETGIFSCDTI